MQSHDGTGSCNNGGVQDPCPQSEITQMIKDGATGTAAGDGLEQCLSETHATDVSESVFPQPPYPSLNNSD